MAPLRPGDGKSLVVGQRLPENSSSFRRSPGLCSHLLRLAPARPQTDAAGVGQAVLNTPSEGRARADSTA
jgi:hypothetical protein